MINDYLVPLLCELSPEEFEELMKELCKERSTFVEVRVLLDLAQYWLHQASDPLSGVLSEDVTLPAQGTPLLH